MMKSIIYKGYEYKIKLFDKNKVILEPICLENICTKLRIKNPESKKPQIVEKNLIVRENPSFSIKKNNKGSYIIVDSKRYYLKEYFDEWIEMIKKEVLYGI